MNRLGLELLASLEQEFAESKIHHLKGTARVRLSQLQFLNPIRPVDLKIVNALKRDFKAEGCLQHEVGFSVPALIDNASLSSALAVLGISAESFKATSAINPAEIEFPNNVKLDCLHGQHRIIAAAEFLPLGDRWWLVDIYGEGQYVQSSVTMLKDLGLNEEARQIFREGHSYSTNFTDGETFRQLRVSQFNGNRAGEDRCRARITANKERDLNKLLKRALLVNALDSILPMKGHWPHFHLGSMDIFLSIKCDEEIACYIELIRKTWSIILGDLLQYLDQQTVELVQLRAPGVSISDSTFLRERMQLGHFQHLFPEIRDPHVRAGIEDRLLRIEYLIPSLYTLFKDLRYLEPAAKAVKALLPDSAKGTLRQSLRFLCSLPVIAGKTSYSLEIQESEASYTTVSGNFPDLFNLAICQLFLCALRYFTSPSNISSKKDMNPIKQTMNGPKRFLGFKLMELACRLGFKVREVDGMLQDSGERLLADMLRGLPSEIFNSDKKASTNLTISFKDYLSSSTITAHSELPPAITTAGIGEPLSRRCGRRCGGPVYDSDRHHLFLRKIYAPLSDSQKEGYDISSFYVKRSIYLAFFGPNQIPEPSAWGTGFVSEQWFQQQSKTTTKISEHDHVLGHTVPDLAANSGGTDLHLPNQDFGSLNEGHARTESGLVSFEYEDGRVISKVPLNNKAVETEARLLAERGFSLKDKRGKHWLSSQCYDVLVDTQTLTLVAVKPITSNGSSRSVAIDPREFMDESGMSRSRGRMLANRDTRDELAHKSRDQNTTKASSHAPLSIPRKYIGLRGNTSGQNTVMGAASLPRANLQVVEEEEL